jgi:hypothetical protein
MTPVGSGRRGHCSPVADGRTVLPTPTRDRTGGTNLGRRSRTRERTLSRGGSREGSRTQVTSRVTGSSAFGPGRASGRQRSSSHQARSHHQRTDRPPGIRGAISRPGATRPARAAGPLASRAHGLSKPSGRRIVGRIRPDSPASTAHSVTSGAAAGSSVGPCRSPASRAHSSGSRAAAGSAGRIRPDSAASRAPSSTRRGSDAVTARSSSDSSICQRRARSGVAAAGRRGVAAARKAAGAGRAAGADGRG